MELRMLKYTRFYGSCTSEFVGKQRSSNGESAPAEARLRIKNAEEQLRLINNHTIKCLFGKRDWNGEIIIIIIIMDCSHGCIIGSTLSVSCIG